MERGYVRLWRKSLDKGWLKNKNNWIFWTWCLMKANHKKDYLHTVGFQEIILQPGQFIFGLKTASEETGLTIQNIRTCVTFLKRCKNLTIKSTNKFSIISITNWGDYQYIEGQSNKPTNKRLTSNQQTTNKRLTTNKNSLNNKTVKKEKSTKKKSDPFLNHLTLKIEEYKFQEHQNKIIEFYKYRMAKSKAKQYKTEKGINGLFRNLKGCAEKGLDISECLEIAMEKDWQAPDPTYFKIDIPQRQINNRSQQNAQACLDFINEDGSNG